MCSLCWTLALLARLQGMVMVSIPQFSNCQYEAPSTAILVCFLGLILGYIGKTVGHFPSYGPLYNQTAVASQVQAMVHDRLLVVLEGIHALLIRVPLYQHATKEFGELRSKYARRQNKQANKRPRLSSKTLRHFVLASLGLALSFCFAA